MNKQSWIGGLALSAILLVGGQAMAQENGQQALAEHFEGIAYDTGPDPELPQTVWHQICSLCDAAARLDPSEPRYLRLLADARLRAGDAPGAIDAFNKYLGIVTDDQVAEGSLIDLHASQIQTAEKIISYARGLVAKTALPAPVRAHAAAVCAQMLADRSQTQDALKMVDTALQIDPINVQALKLKLALDHNQGPVQKCSELLALLRANPLDADAVTSLANEMARVGLVHESARWYLAAINLYTFQGASGTADLAKGAATELYLNGRSADAANVLDSYISSVPTDIDAWSIRLSISKDLPKESAKFKDLSTSAVNNAVARLQSIRASAGATSQPTGGDLGDITGDRALLVKANQSQLTDAYIAAAGDLAWVRLYFLRDAGPRTQAVLDALAKLLPDDDVLLCRLNGWKYLVQGQWAQAREKLSAVADRDPYAALGMVLIHDQAGEKTEADALAKRTMAAHPAEPEAAVLFSALRSHDAQVIPIGQAEGIKTVVTTLSTDWFNIVTRPGDFYTINAAPLNPEVGFNQPMLARVTIQNTGNYDIALGEDAVLHPDFSFDASVRGLLEDDEPNMAVDRFWQRLVLPRGQSTSQIVRLDRGRFKRFLAQHFDVPVDVQFAVTTNPIFVNGQFVAGPAGQHSQFLTLQERASTPIASDQDLQILVTRLGKGSPSDRMYAADAVANFIDQLMSGQPDTRSKSIAGSLLANLRLACKDPDASVRDWATYLVVTRSSPEDREKFVPGMTASDDWSMRLLGIIAAQNLADKGAIAAQALSGDPDKDVKEYANAWSDRLASLNAATTQPAQ